jgi:hypothetical protein
LELASSSAHFKVVETEIAEGLSRLERWLRAEKESDPTKKAALLRPFLITGGANNLTPYELWWSSPLVLDEVAKTGKAGVGLLSELLEEPCYQNSFDPAQLPGFGAQGHACILISLALQEFHVAATLEEKLKKLRPLFDLPQHVTGAGYVPEGLLGEYLDQRLTAVLETGPTYAKPFLHDLLKLPYFQNDYILPMSDHSGREQRAKIEAALATLK